MKKLLYLLLTLTIVYVIFKMTADPKKKSPIGKRINETLNILVWVILLGYLFAFLYWMYTALFG